MAAAKSARRTTALTIRAGSFPPSVQVQHYSPEEWEEFIEECCDIVAELDRTYVRVQRLGGAGDAGRDIEARLQDDLLPDGWDLYQAKHYRNPLTPGEFLPELAKFINNLAAARYPAPRHYLVCAPRNAGPALHDLIAAPDRLKGALLAAWEKGAGTRPFPFELTPELVAFVSGYDFSRVRERTLKELLAIHARDRVRHFRRFKVEVDRGEDPAVPTELAIEEQRYIAELVKVYAESEGVLLTLEDVMSSSIFSEHLEACRAQFYCAEGLRRFSRDIFPEEFEHLLNMIFDGVRATLKHPRLRSGFDRLDAVMTDVDRLKLTDSRLHGRLRGGDLKGACHHLANDGVIKWVR